jgi:hypothetical protein
MSITESPLYKKVVSTKTTDLGNIFFFENYLITEFNEGVEINHSNFEAVRVLIREHFGNENFGLISNRINSYSIVITDAPLFNQCQSLKAYATITYNHFAEKVIDVENYFFKFNKQNFNSLTNAKTWVEETLSLENKAS